MGLIFRDKDRIFLEAENGSKENEK